MIDTAGNAPGILRLQASAGDAFAELLPGHGGILNRLWLDGGKGPVSVIAGITDTGPLARYDHFCSAHLFPFANRLADGAYRFDGRDYRFPINETERHNALHGFLFRDNPESVRQYATDHVQWIFTYRGQFDYYPFPCHVAIDYRLVTAAELGVRFAVTNTGDTQCPVGVGWHPYFTLGQPLDELALQLPPVARIAVNQRLLPTGEKPQDTRFLEMKPIADTHFDDCFELLEPGATVPARLWSEQQQLGLEVWQASDDGGRHFIQVYTAGDRRSIAIEPVSCGLDAFNSRDGLRVLAPGASFSTTFGVRLITDPAPTNPRLNRGR